ncbi:glycosyl hydrolases 18 family protein, partial [Vibrio parahaemolyticus V-223/04]
NVMAAA